MVALPKNSDDIHAKATCDTAVVEPCRPSLNRSIDENTDSPENAMSIPQVSLTSTLVADEERESSLSSDQRSRSSSQPTQSKLSITTHQDEDNERIVENEVHPDMKDGDTKSNSPIDPPPPPPPPPARRSAPSSPRRHRQHHHHHHHHSHHPQQYKFYLRQSVPPTISTQRVPLRRLNRISLHIYDLISSDALMQLPWGCVCEIGKCFNEVNSALHELGTGAYHVGIECNGIEYAYGACSQPNKTGVFSCIPKLSPGYQYRSSIDFGYVPLIRSSWVILPPTLDNDPACVSPRSVTSTSSNNFHYQEEFVDGRLVIKEMATEYMGIDYDILKRNCCTFAADACVRLGVPEEDVPTWFRNLAETGAYSHTNFVEPLQHVLSGVSQQYPNQFHEHQQYNHNTKQHAYSMYPNMNCHNDGYESEPGFEVIAQRNATNTRDVVLVVDANDASFTDRSLRLYRKSETTMAY